MPQISMSYECENLDAFLADDLPADAAGRFEAHLGECASCSDAVKQQRWIDNLLRSPLRLQLEPVSPALSESIRDSIVSRRRKARLAACGLAAAAVLVLAAGWTAVLSRQAAVPADPMMARAEVSGEEPSPGPSLEGRGIANEPPRATFVGGPDVIVVPVATSHPNVTVVRIFPTYQPTYAVQASAEQPAGDGFAWPLDFDDLNGG